MRSRKAIYNILASLTLQIVLVISGFIVPRLTLGYFGSDVNGVISSISQILGYITLLEVGAGGVIMAAMYKPLSNNDDVALSGIVKASDRFFKNVAYLFVVYSLVLAATYPLIVRDFSFLYTAILVLIIAVSTFAQYYFGITYNILLSADQKLYITAAIQIVTIVANTLLVVLLINLGVGIHVVRLGSSLVFVLRPILLNWYVRKNYTLTKKIAPDMSATKQRWDGFATHMAYFMHRNTDMVLITFFLNLKEVSVYYIYFLVITGIQKIINSISSGLTATIGNMIARGEKHTLDKAYGAYELFNNMLTTILFVSCGILIVPFVFVYTKGVTDINYSRPLFAYLFTIAEAVYCVRLPLSSVVYSAGHYRQTRKMAYIEAILKLVLSLVLLPTFGIIGVAISTLVAMTYRTVMFAFYLSKNILKRHYFLFFKGIVEMVLSAALIVIAVSFLPEIPVTSYGSWVIYAVIVTLISVAITLLVNILFNKRSLIDMFSLMKVAVSKKQKTI